MSADHLHALAGSLGRIWRVHRRKLPQEIRHLYIELLLALRNELIPIDGVGTEFNLNRARYDVRRLADLNVFIARREPRMDASGNQQSAQDDGKDCVSEAVDQIGTSCDSHTSKYREKLSLNELIPETPRLNVSDDHTVLQKMQQRLNSVEVQLRDAERAVKHHKVKLHDREKDVRRIEAEMFEKSQIAEVEKRRANDRINELQQLVVSMECQVSASSLLQGADNHGALASASDDVPLSVSSQVADNATESDSF